MHRRSQTFVKDFAGLRRLRKAVRLRHDDEAPSGDSHRRKTVLLQSLRQTVHAERKPSGELNLKYFLA